MKTFSGTGMMIYRAGHDIFLLDFFQKELYYTHYRCDEAFPFAGECLYFYAKRYCHE